MQRKVSILGVGIDNVTMEEALGRVARLIEKGGKYQVVTPNPEHLVIAQDDLEFRKVLDSADLAIPDGVGLIFASKLQKIFNNQNRDDGKAKEQVLKQRVTGTDLMVNLCGKAAEEGWSVFFLGGEEGVAQKAANRLQAQFVGLRVAGSSSVDPEVPIANRQLPMADILFVAYGAPMQEKWIAQHLDQLPVKVAIGLGGAFDFVVGKQKRAPRALQKLGLEWFWRLITQPWRWRRQMRLVKFLYLVMKGLF